MQTPGVAPYGTWTSPFTADVLAKGKLSFKGVRTNPYERRIYLLESRPSERGRSCIVEFSERPTETGQWDCRDVLSAEYNASTTVHEYGGGAFATAPDGDVVFTDAKKRGVFVLNIANGEVKPIVQSREDIRYGDFNCHPSNPYILAIREDHRKKPCENSIVAINADNGAVETLVAGADFYQHPQFNHDGSQICWIQWSHPHMCWRGSQVYIADWTNSKTINPRYIAGAEGKVSVCQPRWGFDGTLYFVSDDTGWWQLYRLKSGSITPEYVRLTGLEEADIGSRGQMLGACTWVPLTAETLLITITRNATQSLILARPEERSYTTIQDTPTNLDKEAIARLSSTEAIIIGAKPTVPEAAYILDITMGTCTLLKQTIDVDTFPGFEGKSVEDFISVSRHLSFPRVFGSFRDGQAHAFYVPPKNPSFTPPEGKRPPCIVWCHGGPHSYYGSGLDLTAQYFATRGYAFVGVNHAGSIGYGRAYREVLYGNWGVIDTADCASCVKYLVDQGLIDAECVGIVGESAGGYAVLQGLCEYPEVYAGGVSVYGISSLESLITDTHKYESHYCPQLVFAPGLSKEEQAMVVEQRSPYLNAQKIKAPLLLLQGDADTVVPKNQALLMEKVMKERGSRAEVVMFEDEGHGFKREDSIRMALGLQEKWWKQSLLR